MMDALDILKAARAKIADPKDWGQLCRPARLCQNTYCVGEAVEESCPPESIMERRRAIRALYNAAGLDIGWGVLVDWNDAPERTHSEVLATFDLAIATLRLS